MSQVPFCVCVLGTCTKHVPNMLVPNANKTKHSVKFHTGFCFCKFKPQSERGERDKEREREREEA